MVLCNAFFVGCFFVISSPMVLPSGRSVVVATAFLEALASGFLYASPSCWRFDTIDDLLHSSSAGHAAKKSVELHSHNWSGTFYSLGSRMMSCSLSTVLFVLSSSLGGGACRVHVALRPSSLGRCGAYLLAACMSGCLLDARACLLCLCLFVCFCLGRSSFGLFGSCLSCLPSLSSPSLSLSLSLPLSLSLSMPQQWEWEYQP